jgi:hypothetical protein
MGPLGPPKYRFSLPAGMCRLANLFNSCYILRVENLEAPVLGRGSLGAVLLSSAIAISCLHDASAQKPRACQEIQKGAPPLPDRDLGIISREVGFTHGRNSHWVTTFSDTANGDTRWEQCFRYEAEDSGILEIRQFYWPLAGISADPLKPGLPRASKLQVRPIADAPIDIASVLWVFENEEGRTRAWAERHYRDGGLIDVKRLAEANSKNLEQTELKNSTEITFVQPDTILPGLDGFLQKNRLPSESFMALHLKQPGIKAPTLHDHYSAPQLEIDVWSTAVREGNDIQFQTVINTKGSAADVSFAVPALRVWDKLRGPLKDLKQYSEFVSIFNHLTKDIERNRGEWVFRWSLPLEALRDGAIYRMDHPVYAIGSDHKECIMVASYSPSPLNFSLENCRSWFRSRPANGALRPAAASRHSRAAAASRHSRAAAASRN